MEATADASGVVDDILRRLLEGGRRGKQVQLSEAEIRQLCLSARRIFLSQPTLLDLHAPIKICGLSSPPPSLFFFVNFSFSWGIGLNYGYAFSWVRGFAVIWERDGDIDARLCWKVFLLCVL